MSEDFESCVGRVGIDVVATYIIVSGGCFRGVYNDSLVCYN
jgi:hypothetical protein